MRGSTTGVQLLLPPAGLRRRRIEVLKWQVGGDCGSELGRCMAQLLSYSPVSGKRELRSGTPRTGRQVSAMVLFSYLRALPQVAVPLTQPSQAR